MSEFDRVLGGGVVPGRSDIDCGEPGVGNLPCFCLLRFEFAETGETVLYLTGKNPLNRLVYGRTVSGRTATTYVADETDLEAILTHIATENPGFIVVDSVQTIASPNVDGRAGGMAQVHGWRQ